MSVLSIVDIAGLVSGASQGEGLGNAFLSHISATDGIFHVVRAFDDPEIVHTELEVGNTIYIHNQQISYFQILSET
jgi:ribosome-binding ATPase YchF (GTP1/OBG family)